MREIVCGRIGRRRVDPSDFACRGLAAELADVWVDYHHKNALRAHGPYPTAVVSFATFVSAHLPTLGLDPAEIRLADERFDIPALIYAWEQDQLTRFSEQSGGPWDHSRALLSLLSHWAERAPGVPDRLRRRLEAPPGVRKASYQALDEFTNTDRQAMQSAAQSDVRALEARLMRGQRLLTAGADPREGGWGVLPNLVWAARHGLARVDVLRQHLPVHAKRWPKPLRDFMAEDPGYRGFTGLMRMLHRLLFPQEIDLHPFRVLLLLAMHDCTPEELHMVQASDVEFNAEGVRIVQAKHRAERIRADFHLMAPASGPSHHGEMAFAGRGRWDVPGLLRRLIQVNALTRETFSFEPWLFTAVEHRRSNGMEPRHAPFTDPGRRFTHWIARHTGPGAAFPKGIAGQHEVRRLRKTAKTTKVVALGGTLSDLAGDDHSIRVFGTHYAHGTTAHVLAGAAMNRAQNKVFDKVTRQPVLVLPDVQTRLGAPEVAAALGVTPAQGADLRDGELDMGVSNCKDPHDSPHSVPGKLCHVAPAMCMACGNAVVFVSQLPQQLLLHDHIEHMRQVLAPPTWEAVWGRQSRSLAAVFAACADLLPAARQLIAERALTLNLPLGMRTEYDR
ncbi:hypothetical protein [Streptomyces halstedii]|uniref:hypothetical protein n=1 Tax=Streptomyces halstedii TaxID=1944 RepID=UPI0036B2C8CF